MHCGNTPVICLMLIERQLHFCDDNVQNCYWLTGNSIAMRTVNNMVNSYGWFFQHFYGFHRRWDPSDIDFPFDTAAFPAASAIVVNIVLSIDLFLIHPWFDWTSFFFPWRIFSFFFVVCFWRFQARLSSVYPFAFRIII